MLYKEENIQHNKNSKTTENMPEEVFVYLFSALRSMHVYKYVMYTNFVLLRKWTTVFIVALRIHHLI